MNRALQIVRADDGTAPMVERERAVQAIDERLNFKPTRERPAYVMKARGVHVSNSFDANGNPVVYAIASSGRAVYALPWLEGDTLEALTACCWDRLDQLDPLPQATRVVSFEPLDEDLLEAR